MLWDCTSMLRATSAIRKLDVRHSEHNKRPGLLKSQATQRCDTETPTLKQHKSFAWFHDQTQRVSPFPTYSLFKFPELEEIAGNMHHVPMDSTLHRENVS